MKSLQFAQNKVFFSRRLVVSADGSHTIFVPEFSEHYHSAKGALAEAQHVFVRHGLENFSAPCLRVLEVGFGTGLNAFLASHYAEKHRQKLIYTALELYPLPLAEAEKLNYPQVAGLSPEIFSRLHTCAWESTIKIRPFFFLKKLQTDLLQAGFEAESFDLVFFDAFAPDVQPEMWSADVFARIFFWLSPKGLLTTYSAKGIVKQALRKAGFEVKRLSGPPGKHHILNAKKTG